MSKRTTQWTDGPGRQTSKTVDHARWIKDRKGVPRLKVDAPSEIIFCQRAREPTGWRNGARVSKRQPVTGGAK